MVRIGIHLEEYVEKDKYSQGCVAIQREECDRWEEIIGDDVLLQVNGQFRQIQRSQWNCAPFDEIEESRTVGKTVSQSP